MSTMVHSALPDLTTAASIRKIRKPLIERKRRERINTSMEQLKALVLQSLDKNEDEYSKMEKADILEMTVQFLRKVPRHRQAVKERPQQTIAAYSCAEETQRYLSAPPRPLVAQTTCTTLVKPIARVGGYPSLTPVAQSTQASVIKPTTQTSVESNTMDLIKYRFGHVDPSLMKPLSIMVPSDRKPQSVWRPW